MISDDKIIICRPRSKHTASPHQLINVWHGTEAIVSLIPSQLLEAEAHSPDGTFLFTTAAPSKSLWFSTPWLHKGALWLFILTAHQMQLLNQDIWNAMPMVETGLYLQEYKQSCFLPSSTVIMLRLLCSNTLLDLIVPKACSDFRNCFALTFPL